MSLGHKKTTFTKLTDIIQFGKYEYESIGWILDNDPDYILWLDSEHLADISEDILSKSEEASFDQDDSDDDYNHNYSSYYDE